MQSKSLLIAIAAFALTATNTYAYSNASVLKRAGLTDSQIEAFAEARELRESGNLDAARDTLIEAGVTESTLKAIREASRDYRQEVVEAIKNNDYQAFRSAIADSPLADIMTSEYDFAQLVEAHEFKSAGEGQKANQILRELGAHHHNHGHGNKQDLSQLNYEQGDALRAARQANDRQTIRAILNEAGID